MLIMFIFAALSFTALLWIFDVALDSYKEYGKAKYRTKLAMYQEGIVSDWRVKPSKQYPIC